MKILKENDCFALGKAVRGLVIGERQEITLPIGTVVTVVLVHGDPDQPKAYEIEAYVHEQDFYVLATVEVDSFNINAISA